MNKDKQAEAEQKLREAAEKYAETVWPKYHIGNTQSKHDFDSGAKSQAAKEYWYGKFINEMKITLGPEPKSDAVAFAEWVGSLSDLQRISLWSEDGSQQGLFRKSYRQLYTEYQQSKNK